MASLKIKIYGQLIALGVLLCSAGQAFAGGGLILQNDVCIITIDFYTAHFTAYQPQTSGNTEYCRDLPDIGETIIVLDYLHPSLKEVPVDFRIIRDVTGLGQFVRWEDVQKIENIESNTVFYRPPAVEADGSYRIQFEFLEKGDFVGIVTAGHPSNGKLYNAVFPFSVGASKFPFWMLYLLAAGLFVLLFRYAYTSMSATRAAQ